MAFKTNLVRDAILAKILKFYFITFFAVQTIHKKNDTLEFIQLGYQSKYFRSEQCPNNCNPFMVKKSYK